MKPSVNIKTVQEKLQSAGFDPGPIDGVWGARTEGALDQALGLRTRWLAWGARVSKEFRDEVFALCRRQELNPNNLMACMAFETGEKFSPSVRNPRSSATGLIQFMDKTANYLGTTTHALAAMTAVEQLAYVEKYFAGRSIRGRCKTMSDTYMAILWPRAIGKPEDYVLWKTGTPAFAVNRGLDTNRSGDVTKEEASSKVWHTMMRGLRDDNIWRMGA